MPELEIIATTYFVHETEYRIDYDKWDSREIMKDTRAYGPYDSRKAAEKKLVKVKKKAIEDGWEEGAQPHRLFHRRGGVWIAEEKDISIDEHKEKLGSLDEYLKNNQ